MRFAFLRPEYLTYILFGSIIVLSWYLLTCVRYKKFLNKFGNYKFLVKGGQIYSASRIFLRQFTILLILINLGLVMVGIYRIKKALEPQYEGMQVVFVLDGSISMLAEDVQPSRFLRAKQEIEEVSDLLCAKGDRLGLVLFAEIGVPYIPVLTSECTTFQSYIKDLDEIFLVENMPSGSTISDGFVEGLKLFKDNNQNKVLIMISDGEPADVMDPDLAYLQNKMAESVTEYAKKTNVSLFLLGIGDPSRKSLIPQKDGQGNKIGYYRYDQGEKENEFLLTSPNVWFLQDVANMFRGIYRHSTTGHDLKGMMYRIIEEKRPIVKYVEREDRENISKYFLIFALLLMFCVPIIKSP